MINSPQIIPYPEKVVPPSIMLHAKSISDIVNYVRPKLLGNHCIKLEYINHGFLVDL